MFLISHCRTEWSERTGYLSIRDLLSALFPCSLNYLSRSSGILGVCVVIKKYINSRDLIFFMTCPIESGFTTLSILKLFECKMAMLEFLSFIS